MSNNRRAYCLPCYQDNDLKVMVKKMLVEFSICDLLFLKSKIPRGKNVWSSEVEIFHFNWLFGLLVNLYPAEVPKSRLRTLHLRGQLNTPHHTYPPLVTLLCPNTKKWRVWTCWSLIDLKFLFFFIIELFKKLFSATKEILSTKFIFQWMGWKFTMQRRCYRNMSLQE